LSNVFSLAIVKDDDREPGKVIDRVRDINPQTVIVIGVDADGFPFFASSTPDGREILWLMERSKMKLLAGEYE
jgi:hypothetical protein